MAKDLVNVRSFLKTGKTRGIPGWATKFKNDLTVDGFDVLYKGRVIVPKEKVDEFIRKKLYSTDGTLPYGRDSAHHVLLKTTVGVSRRALMEFLRRQRTLQVSKPSLAKAKTRPGIKISKLTLEFDLVFLRKTDLKQANRKFGRDKTISKQTYILTTVEAASGLTKLSFIKTKDQTTSELLKHIKWFAEKFGVAPSKMSAKSDAGTEFVARRIKAVCPDYQIVSSGKSVERKNRQVQSNFFRILKNRQATTILAALQKAEDMCNNTVNRKFKKTANELISEKMVPKEIVKQHNNTRALFRAGDNRGDLKVGDYVRVLAPEKKRKGIAYKTYKELSYESHIRRILKTTGPRAKTRKYKLDDQRWKLIDQLLKSAPEDRVSEQLIKERTDKADAALDRESQRERELKEEEAQGKIKHKGRQRRKAAKQMIENLQKMQEVEKQQAEEDKEDADFDKAQQRLADRLKRKVKPVPKRKVKPVKKREKPEQDKKTKLSRGDNVLSAIYWLWGKTGKTEVTRGDIKQMASSENITNIHIANVFTHLQNKKFVQSTKKIGRSKVYEKTPAFDAHYKAHPYKIRKAFLK